MGYGCGGKSFLHNFKYSNGSYTHNYDDHTSDLQELRNNIYMIANTKADFSFETGSNYMFTKQCTRKIDA